MSQYGATHELVVEYTNQGSEPDEQEAAAGRRADAYECSVHYIIRHPEDCWPDWRKDAGEKPEDICPIDQQIQDIGLEEALGLLHWRNHRNVIEHLPEGLYSVNAWMTHYSSPEGDDWDGGLEWERKDLPLDPPIPDKSALAFVERP